jgi:uncharacterized phage-like protein YoqJ
VTTYGVTGHRFVDQQPGELSEFARLSVTRMIEAGATEIITGMALGWDLAVAEACIDLGVPFTAAIPFAGQQGRWPEAEQQRYIDALRCASVVQMVSHLPLRNAFQRRNRWIVDHCEELWALYSGKPGGTCNCVLYASAMGRRVKDLWDDWMRFRTEGAAL